MQIWFCSTIHTTWHILNISQRISFETLEYGHIWYCSHVIILLYLHSFCICNFLSWIFMLKASSLYISLSLQCIEITFNLYEISNIISFINRIHSGWFIDSIIVLTYVAPIRRKRPSSSINLKLSIAVRLPTNRSTSPVR